MNNKILIAIVIVAILAIGAFLFASGGTATVTATGSAQIEAEPDKVSVNVYIEKRAPTAQEAKDLHDEALDDLVVNLIRIGIDKDDIKMQNFNVYPEYEWSDGQNKQKGFIARQDIIIETEDFDQVASIVDGTIDAGGLVSYINFELSEEKQNSYKVQALEKAGKDARRKAEATAAGLGKKLGSLVSVQSEEFNYFPYNYFQAKTADSVSVAEAAAEVRQAAINLDPREIQVSASIRVEYKLRNF